MKTNFIEVSNTHVLTSLTEKKRTNWFYFNDSTPFTFHYFIIFFPRIVTRFCNTNFFVSWYCFHQKKFSASKTKHTWNKFILEVNINKCGSYYKKKKLINESESRKQTRGREFHLNGSHCEHRYLNLFPFEITQKLIGNT